jgi:eukaryotic-like serine/threonine-protein kinase
LQESEPTFGDGRYIVRRELGRGTMGVVYEAEDPVLGRTVAVKTIDLLFPAGAAVRTDFERRFFTEARVAAQLSHPGIVVCHDVGKDAASGRLFIVFEHLRGRTLEERLAEGPLEWREALGVVVQVARAIQHAHEHGVVHRDLKPANIMLLDRDASGSGTRAEAAVKIMDFGVARLESIGPRITRTGQAFGSPLYMSPEQALGQPSSARSDIFSLGSVLCTLVLGRPWFAAPNLPKIVDRLAHDDPPRLSRLRPGVPPSLDLVVAKALAKLEAERYRSAADMADDLEDVLAGRATRHAFGPAPSSRGGASDEELLLAGLAAPPSGPRRPGPHDPLASLLDDAPVPAPAPILGSTTPMTVAPPVRSRRPWLAAALFGLAALAAAGAFLLARGARAPQASPPATVPALPSAAPTLVAEREPEPPAPTTLPPSPVATLPEATPSAPPSAVPTVRAARPAATPTPAATAVPVTEPPAPEVPVVSEPAPATAGSRIRLAVTHPFEDGRLIVWIDGVLVHEAKLQASSSRRIVAFKVREGSAQSMLDVTPGPHEVRVEVTWNQGRTTRTKVVDVAEGATGLLEARVGRMSKDLSLSWSRLAKD